MHPFYFGLGVLFFFFLSVPVLSIELDQEAEHWELDQKFKYANWNLTNWQEHSHWENLTKSLNMPLELDQKFKHAIGT